LLELKKKNPPKKKEEDKKKKQQQQKQPQSKMSPKEAQQRLQLLAQKEKEVQQRIQKEKSKSGATKRKIGDFIPIFSNKIIPMKRIRLLFLFPLTLCLQSCVVSDAVFCAINNEEIIQFDSSGSGVYSMRLDFH
jgi:hypothetical protein